MHCDSCKKCTFLGFFWLFSLQFFSMGYDGCILYAFLQRPSFFVFVLFQALVDEREDGFIWERCPI